MEDFEMIMVASSTISAIGYREDLQTLRIQFQNGNIYEYYNFPLIEFENFKTAPSLGSYFNHHIKNNYPYNKIG